MKKKTVISLIVVWLAGFVVFILNAVSDAEADIMTAFESTDYLSTNGTINVYGSYGNRYLSENEKYELIENICKETGIIIDNNSSLETVEQGSYATGGKKYITSYKKYAKNAVSEIKIITVEEKDSDNVISVNQHIYAGITVDDSVESAVYYKEKLEEAFGKMNIPADVILNLKGCVSGTLSNRRKNQIAEEIIERLDGKIVTGNISDDLYTVYAYSDSIKDFVLNGTIKSNINIAINYDEISDVTWIYLATPVISELF